MERLWTLLKLDRNKTFSCLKNIRGLLTKKLIYFTSTRPGWAWKAVLIGMIECRIDKCRERIEVELMIPLVK